MVRNFNGKINPVKRNHTLDRRRGYRSPSETDQLCPAFEHMWAYFKDEGYYPDYVGLCGNFEKVCDYRKEVVPGLFSFCHRYNKEDNEGFAPAPSVYDESGNRQSIQLNYHLRRLFRDKNVQLRMSLEREVQIFADLLRHSDIQWGIFSTNARGEAAGIETTSSGLKILDNNGYITAQYVKNSVDLSSYTFETTVTFDDGDDDSAIIIFRFDPDTKHFYSLEWNRGGQTPAGLSVIKNICTNPATMTYQRTTLFHDPGFTWLTGGYAYTIRLVVSDTSVNGNITHQRWEWVPYRWLHWDHYHTDYHWELRTHNRSFAVSLNDDRLKKGAYGLGSNSQVLRYNAFQGHVMVKSGVTNYYKTVPLSPVSDRIGGGKILTEQTVGEIFEEDRDAYLRGGSITRDQLIKEEYAVMSHNVQEGVVFKDGTTVTKNADLPMAITSWNYDTDVFYTKNLTISDHLPQVLTDTYTIANDAYVKKVQVAFSTIWMDDAFDLTVDRKPIYSNTSVLTRFFTTEFTDDEMYAQTDGTIDFVYEVKRNPILFFYNERHIDTHNKRWNIKENKLHWHKDEVIL